MDTALKTALTQVMTEMEKTIEGQAALKSYEDTTRFDMVPAGTFEQMQALFKMVSDALPK